MHIHWYKRVFDTVVWEYAECRCGKRNAFKISGGYQPVNLGWIDRIK